MSSQLEPEDQETKALAERLRQARERLGVSTRDLARIAGIPAATISALERGRDPRWSTLIKYLETVPGLRAADLLPGPIVHPPAASPSVAAWLRRAHACGARRVTLTRSGAPGAERLELDVEGLTTELPQPVANTTAAMLMRLAMIAPRDVVLGLSLEEGESRVAMTAAGVDHVFDIAWEDPPLIRYRRTEALDPEAAAATSLELESTFPAKELIFRAELPAAVDPAHVRLLAWPATRRVEGDAGEISAYLYPGALRPRARRDGPFVSVTVTEVVPGLVHAIEWSEAEASPAAAARLDEEGEDERGFAPILRELRRRTGRSLRDLALSMGVAHSTLCEAEHGRDPRASTLRRVCRPLPDVPPQWLLPAREALGDVTPLEAWTWIRDLHGIEAEEVTASVVVSPEGPYETEDVWVRVRALDGRARPVVVSRVAGKDLHGNIQTTLQAMETDAGEDEEDVRSRLRNLPAGRPLQELWIPAALTQRGLSWRMALLSRPGFLLSRAAAIAKHGTDQPVISGVSLTPMLPARRARLRIRFPAGFEATAIWAVALPAERPYSSLRNGVLDRAHPGAHAFTSSPDGLEHELVVELPLPGLKYGIGWSL